MRPLRVLLAVDQAIVRQALRERLARETDLAVVAEAATARDAVRLLLDGRPDAVVLHLDLLRLEALLLAERLRAAAGNARIVTLGHACHQDYPGDLLHLGPATYLPPSASLDDVVQFLRRVKVGEGNADCGVASRQPAGPALTRRELEVLCNVITGRSNEEIALRLDLSESRVEQLVHQLSEKLGVRSRTALVTAAFQRDWVGAVRPQR